MARLTPVYNSIGRNLVISAPESACMVEFKDEIQC